ncbi:hypothetical protein [Corynebacterium sp.]|uniref:hypothetical protein n=1 Tax=Corynebacterium sp. TaxID=1720 RepID=UPI0026DD327A|nr:hypothetical protein [Corynebacterium sp.]MDO5032141.1 hypothetical protein [Corynebacterium sp.]
MEIAPYAASRGPQVMSADKLVALIGASAVLVGVGSFFGIGAMIDTPEKADFAIEAAESTVAVDIIDPDDVLSPEDEARMLRDAPRITAPAVVTELHYMVFARNDDNVNDTVENYLRDHLPETIGDDTFADGQAFVGVGLDPRQAFVFAGEDVADALQLRKGDAHLSEAIEAIKPGVRDNNIPGGLFAGAREALDVDKAQEARFNAAQGDRVGAMVGGGIGLGVAAGGVAGGIGGARRSRQKKILTARKDWDYVTQKYTDVAQRLQAIDVRAHSLESELVDSHLRHEWESLRDEFLALDSTLSPALRLKADSPDAEFLQQADLLATSKSTCQRVVTAEGNIDKLFGVEHADPKARDYELYRLRKDLLDAAQEHPFIRPDAEALAERTRRLDVQAPDFMEQYLELLDRSSFLFDQVQAKLAGQNKATDRPARPRIDDPAFYTGVGYHGFVPYAVVSSWNSSAMQASASAGSVNSGFSSGFSGAGGSSSF